MQRFLAVKTLIQSGESKLVEAVRADRFWSCGFNPHDAKTTKPTYYPGMNNLGRLLEYIRGNLQKECETQDAEQTESAPSSTCVPNETVSSKTPDAPIPTCPSVLPTTESLNTHESCSESTGASPSLPEPPSASTITTDPVTVSHGTSPAERSSRTECATPDHDNDFELLPRVLLPANQAIDRKNGRSRTLVKQAQRIRSSSLADIDRTDMRPIDEFFAPMKRKASGTATSPTSEVATKMTKIAIEGVQNASPLQRLNNCAKTSDVS